MERNKYFWRAVFLYLPSKDIIKLKRLSKYFCSFITEESRKYLVQPIYEIGVVCRDFNQLTKTVTTYFNLKGSFSDNFHLLNITYQFANHFRIYNSVEVEYIGKDENHLKRTSSFRRETESSNKYSLSVVGYNRMSIRFYPILLLTQQSVIDEKKVLANDALSFIDGYIYLYPTFSGNTNGQITKSNSFRLTENFRDFCSAVLKDCNFNPIQQIVKGRIARSASDVTTQEVRLSSELSEDDDQMEMIQTMDEKTTLQVVAKGESPDKAILNCVNFIVNESPTTIRYNDKLPYYSPVNFIKTLTKTKDYKLRIEIVERHFKNLYSYYELLTTQINYFVKRIGLRYFTLRDQMLILKKCYSVLFNNDIENNIVKYSFDWKKVVSEKLKTSFTKREEIKDYKSMFFYLVSLTNSQERKAIRKEPEIIINRDVFEVKFDEITSTGLRHVDINISLVGNYSKTRAIIRSYFTIPHNEELFTLQLTDECFKPNFKTTNQVM